MKTLAIVALLLCGAAFFIHENQLSVDPSGKLTLEKAKALNGGILPQTGVIADPSGTLQLKKAQASSLAQGN